MSNYFYITGTSSGIGKALSLALIQKSNLNIVHGISRNCTIKHSRYFHHRIDLTDTKTLTHWEFPLPAKASRLILINNAGIVGDISYVGHIDNQSLIDTISTNLTAPILLSNLFLKQTTNLPLAKKQIINISSGAAQSVYDGWGAYCASKAGLDMWTRVINEELRQTSSKCTVQSIAPGVVETPMQDKLRSADSAFFSRKSKFVELKAKNALYSTTKVANRLIEMMENPSEENIISRVVL